MKVWMKVLVEGRLRETLRMINKAHLLNNISHLCISESCSDVQHTFRESYRQ